MSRGSAPLRKITHSRLTRVPDDMGGPFYVDTLACGHVGIRDRWVAKPESRRCWACASEKLHANLDTVSPPPEKR